MSSPAEKQRQSIQEGEAQLLLLRIITNSIEELQACEVEIAKLRAIDGATRPLISIDNEGETAGTVGRAA